MPLTKKHSLYVTHLKNTRILLVLAATKLKEVVF